MKTARILLPLLIIFLFGCNKPNTSDPIVVDITKKGEPISEYIYGQFIEHMGNCINNGIWAEMLQDRKFYYPIKYGKSGWKDFKPGTTPSAGGGPVIKTLQGSPWRVIGKENTIEMISEDAYNGVHQVRIHSAVKNPCGIVQDSLAVTEGKKYSGRIVLSCVEGSIPLHLSLIWGEEPQDKQSILIEDITSELNTYHFEFTALKTSDQVSLEILTTGKGVIEIAAISLMPSDNIEGFRADVVQLLKELNSPVYRWPGGNFVSGYDWRDGIGDRDKRPPRKNPAWQGIEPNDVGIHEFMKLSEIIDTEPYVAINTGKGNFKLAVDEVEYFNGSVATAMGQLRAENGHPEPYHVKFWGVGNEMYGRWQLGYMPLDEYTVKHNHIAKAIKEVYPEMIRVAVGYVEEEDPMLDNKADLTPDWTPTMLRECANEMELISEHFYCFIPSDDVIEHVGLMKREIKRIADAHREYRKTINEISGKDIRIAMDEWNYWYGVHKYGELGVVYHLKDGLGVAAGLHEYYRNSDLFFMANYAQTVNVIGAIKTNKTAAEFDITGLVLKMYREHFGEIPVEIQNMPDKLDVSAALSKDQSMLTISVVNPTTETHDLDLELIDFEVERHAEMIVLSSDDAMDYNAPGEERKVDIIEKQIKFKKTCQVCPLSTTIFKFKIQGLR